MDINNTVGKVKRLGGYTGKMVVVGVLVIICWIGSLLVLGVVSERQGRQAEAEARIGNEWGEPQLVAAPVMVVPLNKFGTVYSASSGGNISARRVLYILPEDLSVDTKLEPEIRSRGIFSAPVYRADVVLDGKFVHPDLSELGLLESDVRWAEATVAMGFADIRNINISSGTLGSAPLTFVSGSPYWAVNNQGVHARTPLVPAWTSQDFSVSLGLTGSKGISFLPLGSNTKVSVSAPWGSPSFGGAYLPKTESIESDNFSANWEISALGRSYSEVWEGSGATINLNSYEEHSYGFMGSPTTKPFAAFGSDSDVGRAFGQSAFGVNLFREVTFYTLVSRTVKYAILFIALTFLAFYLFEVVSGTRVHPFQYLLIGAALVLFYLLLLSFAEHLGFGASYLLSAIMTLGMVTAYSASVLKARSRSWMVAAILAVLYAYLYAILQLENYALLFGTLFLFIALAAVMRATRGIEWYKEVE